MTTTVLRPNGTPGDDADWVRTGGTTKHGVLSDDSDATYIEATGSANAGIEFDLGTYTLPAGAVVKTIRVRVRARVGSEPKTVTTAIITPATENPPNDPFHTGSFAIVGTTLTEYATSATAETLSQATIDGMRLQLLHVAANPFTSVRLAEAYVDLVTAEVPVAAITYPTGTPAITTTNRPTYTWTHTPGSDGGAQTFYEVKVYTAAQYGDGGFSPDTSTTHWTSGIVVGSATSQLSGVLANSTTYRVYVRTAQTINGTAQWSAWDFEGFSIAVTTSDVSAIATTADDANGRILVVVDRSGSAWDFVEVQRSVDSGTTWEYVRGGEYVVPATTSLWSTGDASNFDIYDYELANGTTAIYRARATRIVSDVPITGAWVESTPAISWSSATAIWLKAPDDPTLNKTVKFQVVPEPSFDRPQGVFGVIGRPNPVVISDVLSGGAGTLLFQTADDTEMDAMFALLRESVLLLHPTLGWTIGPQYIAPGGVQQVAITTRFAHPIRRFEVVYHQVDAPADSLAGTP